MHNNLFLVDTSAWLLVLRQNFISQAKDRIDYLLKEDVIITTGIVKLEILSGTRSENEFQRLKMRLDALGAVETDDSLYR